MEWLGLERRVFLDLVKGSEDLVVDGPPAVVLDSLVPPLVVVAFILVELDVDTLLLFLLLQLMVVSGCESIDVNDCSMHEDFVVNQRRELESSQSETDVAPCRWVQEMGLTSVDALQ